MSVHEPPISSGTEGPDVEVPRCVHCGTKLLINPIGPCSWCKLPQGSSNVPTAPVRDPWLGHLVRYLGFSLIVSIPIFGWAYFAHLCRRTEYRMVDFLWMLVPFAGLVVATKVCWRYSARSIYWTKHPHFESAVLSGRNRPWIIAGVWAVGLLFWAGFGAFIVNAANSSHWTHTDRVFVTVVLQQEGLTPEEAECVVDVMEDEVKFPRLASDEEFAKATFAGVLKCDIALGEG